MLAGTDFSTLADAEGHFQFHHLPAGPADILVLRAGSIPLKTHVEIAAQGAMEKNVELTPEPTAANLVRNSSFNSTWLGGSRPDDWYPTKPKLGGPCWEGEFLPLTIGVRYRLQVDWKDGASGTISVRLGKGVNTPDVEVPSITPGKSEVEFTGSPEITFAQAQIHCAGPPANVCSHVAIFPVPESAASAGQ